MSSERDGGDQDDLSSSLPYLLASDTIILMVLLLRYLFYPDEQF